jgi:hypothetical protein
VRKVPTVYEGSVGMYLTCCVHLLGVLGTKLIWEMQKIFSDGYRLASRRRQKCMSNGMPKETEHRTK